MSDSDSSENESDARCSDDNGNEDDIVRNKMNGKSRDAKNRINDDIRDDNLSKIEEILRTVFESNSSLLTSAIEREMKLFSDTTTEDDDDEEEVIKIDGETELIECDLETYLRRYDTQIGVDLDVQKMMKTKMIQSPVAEPPDVVKKSESQCDFDGTIAKPDILLNVQEENGANVGDSPSSLSGKDETTTQWSITPVDIVGDFEQEVKRELGLLMNGYDVCRPETKCDDILHGKMKEKVSALVEHQITRHNLIISFIFLLDTRRCTVRCERFALH